MRVSDGRCTLMDLGHAVQIASAARACAAATSGMPSVSSAAKGAADVDRLFAVRRNSGT
jgi:hypothetical protein